MLKMATSAPKCVPYRKLLFSANVDGSIQNYVSWQLVQELDVLTPIAMLERAEAEVAMYCGRLTVYINVVMKM